MSDPALAPAASVVTSVIDLAAGKSGDASAAADVVPAPAATEGAPIDRVKAVISLVVVGFAGVMSYIGLQGTDLTTVMRNQPLLVQFMGLFVLLAVVTAILSVFVKELGTGDMTLGMELGVISGQLALFPLVQAITPIPFVTTPGQTTAGWAVAGALAVLAVILVAFSVPLKASTVPDGAAQRHGEGQELIARPRWRKLLGRRADHTRFYIFLLVVSLLFTSLAVYTGLRVEVRNQLAAGVGLQASLHETGAQGVVTLDISASRLAAEDFLVVNVTALPSHPTIASDCRDVPTPPGKYSCAADPCSSAYPSVAQHCDSLVGWDVPPDAAGNVERHLTFPFSTVAYQRLHIETATCERASSAATCDLGQSNHIDLAVPGP